MAGGTWALARIIVLVYSQIMTVGERLSRARMRLGKKQSEVAALLDKSQPTIHEWETDKSLPKTDEIREVARVYGVRPELLLPKLPRKPRKKAS